jgi:hypothetical protein
MIPIIDQITESTSIFIIDNSSCQQWWLAGFWKFSIKFKISIRRYRQKHWQKNPYKISQFYRRKYSVGVWLPVRRWFIYWRLHWWNTSVSFLLVCNSTFRRYIGRKHKKNHLPMVLQTKFACQKKVSRLKYTDGFYSVGDIVIYRWLRTVGNFFGECLKYRPNISVRKFIGNCGRYCQMPTDSVRR